MTSIDFKIKNIKYGTMRAKMICDDVYYSAKDLCRVLGYPNDKIARKLVSTGNQTEYTEFADDYSIIDQETFVSSSGVLELLEKSFSPKRHSVKNWFNYFIFPKFESLMEQLEELTEDYCTVEITVNG